MELNSGAYDSLISQAIDDALSKSQLVPAKAKLDAVEAPNQFARLVAEVTRRAIASIPTADRAALGAELTNTVLETIQAELKKVNTQPDRVQTDPEPQLLTALAPPTPTGKPTEIAHPNTPLAQTSLLTNAPKEPSLLNELESELASADSVEILGAFIRFSGIRQLIPAIERLIQRGGSVRVMTTTYTGTTEARALTDLQKVGAEVRISYDTTATRLHAKAWLFRRNSGFTTAYIGSSNLTHQAQVTGLEWNVRASMVTNPDVIDKFEATFESYWNDDSFVPFDEDEFAAHRQSTITSSDNADFDFAFVDLVPKAFQQAMLDRVEFERTQGHTRNLIVSATGTGKTVMAAIDYRNLRYSLDRSRLLFVAHRKEILKQSRRTFQLALKNASFGELWVDGARPAEWEHVFASVQSIAAGDLEALPPDHFDVVIIDEFHHAEAATYQQLLDYLTPQQMLGLTATPERADGLNVIDRFEGRIAAELRLWDALEQGLLSPFHYFGIADGTDLSGVKWARGRYATEDLTNVYTADDAWLGKVLQALNETVTDPNSMRALGFCVSVAHANFMAQRFRRANLKAVAVTGETPKAERNKAVTDLRTGAIQAIFSVDVFNEGVDIPEVDTVLFLRPTESATIFLQQLGRGLRRTDDTAHSVKDVLTVLDFVGHQRTEFRFDQRFRKLLGGNRTEVEKQIEQDFPFLPAGCSIRLDKVTKELVLANIKAAIPTGWADRKRESRALGDLSLSEFLEATGLELADIYAGDHSFTELRRASGYLPEEASTDERSIARAIRRMLHVNDRHRLDFFLALLGRHEVPDELDLSADELRVATMMHYLVWRVKHPKPLTTGWQQLWNSGPIFDELKTVIAMMRADLHRPTGSAAFAQGNPLNLHAHYSRDEVLAAFDVGSPGKPPSVREGVKWVEEHKIDLFFVTLNKSDKDYSPSTMYHDYAINRELFHWESQSTTSAESPTGQRYIAHRANGTGVALFVRNGKKDANGHTAPYVCLGLVDYVSHTGSRPIAITWKLRTPMPAADFMSYRAAVA